MENETQTDAVATAVATAAPTKSVADLLAATNEKKPWIPATLEVQDGQYVLRFPGKIPEAALKVSSTGKSLVATIRAEVGRTRQPIIVERTNGSETVREFGSINVNLTLS